MRPPLFTLTLTSGGIAGFISLYAYELNDATSEWLSAYSVPFWSLFVVCLILVWIDHLQNR